MRCPQFVRVTTSTGKELVFNNAVAVATVPAFVFPTNPIALLLGFGTRIFAMISSLPYLHDSQHWCLQSDLAIFGALVYTLMTRIRKEKTLPATLFRNVKGQESVALTTNASATVRVQFLWAYFAAGFWKFNEGFMTPRYSCAPVYLVQLVERNLPASLLAQHPEAIELLTWAAPTIILGVELIIPVLLYLEVRSGAFFAAIFHWAIAITPPPNAVASFGVQTLPRMLLLIPDPAAAASAVFATMKLGWTGLFIVSFAALTMALQPATWGSVSFDKNHATFITVPLCGAFAGIICVAAVNSYSYATGLTKTSASMRNPGAYGYILRGWAFFYAIIVLVLGLMDMGTANMFSSLRMYGGGNHYLLPTGLLQSTFMDYDPSASVIGEAFGGGIVRIDSSNSTHFTGSRGFRFPGEIYGHTQGALELLKASGHSGRQWSPTSFACAIGNHPHVYDENLGLGKDHTLRAVNTGLGSKTGYGDEDNSGLGQAAANQPVNATAHHDPFSIPSPEVRRIIREARSRHPSENFDIVGALLPGKEGDELWRAYSAVERFHLRRRVSSEGTEVISCYDPDGVECSDKLQGILLTPASSHWFAWLVRRLLFSQPYPIVAEDIGPHRRVHCFGP